MAPAQAQALFVDTSAWVALLHRADQAHRPATAAWPGIRDGRRQLVTTNLVLAETHALLTRRLGANAALAFWDRLTFRARQRIVWADAELTQAAVEAWLRKRLNRGFSLADAVSFEVMRREDITEAFAFDRDFERAGFALLSA
ncbi:MAG: PIN domain-containing protein [Gemmatimonadetes bacterium]|nr:PIN domain-containing protein [Gemmatimonadota bacterium]MBI2404277.1 PIN domain-containing protein [Gemmatimonadota bacterium]